MSDRFSSWVDRYRKAWESNDPDDIGSLFTDEALYYTEPYAEPKRGRSEIVEDWIERRDAPGDTEWTYEVIGRDGDLAFVQGATVYKDPPRIFSNLWVFRLEADVCSEFTEWWMKQE